MQAEDSLGGLLGKSSRLLSNRLHQNLQQIERQMTVEQWVLLAELWSEDGLSQLELSSRLLKNKASVTSLLKGAEKSGFVYRLEDSYDKRMKKVFLTDKGRQLETTLLPIAKQTIEQSVNNIKPDHLAITEHVLKQIIANLIDGQNAEKNNLKRSETMTEILVTGATGNVGQELTRLAVQNNVKVRVATRDPKKVRSFFGETAIDIAAFDFYSPQTYQSALAGTKAIFLVAPSGDSATVDQIVVNFIDEAIAQGCKHITFCSARAVAHIDRSLSMHKIENYLAISEIDHTILRPSWFMQNFNTMLANSIKHANAIHLPCGNAKCSFIDTRDIADVALKTLLESGHNGKTYTLSGPKSLSFTDVAEKLSAVIGKEITYVDISADAFISSMQKRGVPEETVCFLAFLFNLLKQGTEEAVLPDIKTVLGHELIDFDRYAQDYASIWVD